MKSSKLSWKEVSDVKKSCSLKIKVLKFYYVKDKASDENLC